MAKKGYTGLSTDLLAQLSNVQEHQDKLDGVVKPKQLQKDKHGKLKAENGYGEVISYYTIESISEYLSSKKESELASLEDKVLLGKNTVLDNQIKMDFGTSTNTGGSKGIVTGTETSTNPFENNSFGSNTPYNGVPTSVELGSATEEDNTSETIFGTSSGVFGLMSLDELNSVQPIEPTIKEPELSVQEQGVINRLKDGDDTSLHQLKIQKVSGVHYLDIIKGVENFITLDISVKSTGWVRKIGDKLEVGAYSITTKDKHDLLGRRDEFRQFLTNLAGDVHYDFIGVEDVIGSVNFETARILYQLNPLADDLILEGVIKADIVHRKDNNYWKKVLKTLSNYKAPYAGYSNHKQIIRDSLYLIHFGDRTTDTIIEDMYDALGLGVVCSYEHVHGKKEHKVKLKTSVNGYYLKQFSTYDEALDYANKQLGLIHIKDCSSSRKDYQKELKALVEEVESDNDIYLISIPTNRIGVPAIQNGFNLDLEMSYVVSRKKNRKKQANE